jgi:IclR family transcriptional regulator, KDG regulon repressor
VWLAGGGRVGTLTPDTITEPARLRKKIDEVRTAGIAFDDGEFDGEVRRAAMAVRDFSGQVVGAIGISGPVWRMSIQALQSRSRHLEAAAARLSQAFGAPGRKTG